MKFYENTKKLLENKTYRLSKHFDKHISVNGTGFTWHGHSDIYEYGKRGVKFGSVHDCLKVHWDIFAFAIQYACTGLSDAHDVSQLCHNICCIKLEHLQ